MSGVLDCFPYDSRRVIATTHRVVRPGPINGLSVAL